MLEEFFIESLPIEYDELSPEQIYAFKSLQNRKEILQISEKKLIIIEVTDLGKKLIDSKINLKI